MDNMVYAVCNGGPSKSKFSYPLQERLQGISQNPGVYVLGVYDCCREKLSMQMRGTGAREYDNLDEVDDQNSIFWFGCGENRGVDEKSNLCVDFF